MTADRGKALAVLGGQPAFREQVLVGRPNPIDRDRLVGRLDAILERNWLSNGGPCVRELEQRIADMLCVRHCIATCNGTIALEIAIRALGLTGDVIVPAFTFVATAHALQWQQVRPIFCDVDPDHHAIDPDAVAKLISPRTSGIIGVHLWGETCDVEALTAIARKHDLKLMFDAAHAFGCSRHGRMVGNFGDAEAFSFHATKFLSTFEGGAVTTNNDDLAAKMRRMTNFGLQGPDDGTSIGTNGKMSEISAAMGLVSLDGIEAVIERNRENYRAYRDGLASIAGLRLLDYDRSERRNFQYIVIEVDEAAAGLTRDEIVTVLRAENVLTRRYFHPGCHRMEPYRSLYPDAAARLPRTELLADRVMALPTGMAVDRGTIETICGLLRAATEQAPAVRQRLAQPAGSAL